jgi:hypothetical protein
MIGNDLMNDTTAVMTTTEGPSSAIRRSSFDSIPKLPRRDVHNNVTDNNNNNKTSIITDGVCANVVDADATADAPVAVRRSSFDSIPMPPKRMGSSYNIDDFEDDNDADDDDDHHNNDNENGAAPEEKPN